MAEPTVDVIGNKASEQGAHEEGADFEGINRSRFPGSIDPLDVTASVSEAGDLHIVPIKLGTSRPRPTEMLDSPRHITEAQLLDSPEHHPPVLHEAQQQLAVSIRNYDRALEISTRNNRERLVYFRIRPNQEMAVAGDRCLVRHDTMESVYSCRLCRGTGKSLETCPVCKGDKISHDRPCPKCGVLGYGREIKQPSGFVPCVACSGAGWAGGVVFPEVAQSIPITGIVVSLGPETVLYKLGDRVQFSRYAGHQNQTPEGELYSTVRECEVLQIIRDVEVTNAPQER